jgi:hypothetical protein
MQLLNLVVRKLLIADSPYDEPDLEESQSSAAGALMSFRRPGPLVSRNWFDGDFALPSLPHDR